MTSTSKKTPRKSAKSKPGKEKAVTAISQAPSDVVSSLQPAAKIHTPHLHHRGRQFYGTHISVDERVNAIYTLLLNGLSRREIRAFIRENARKEEEDKKIPRDKWRWHWDVDDKTVDTYVTRANRIFAEMSTVYRDREYGRTLARYDMLFRKFLAVNDFRGALSVEQARTAFLGLNAPIKIDQRTQIMNGNGVPASGPEEIRRILGTEAYRAAQRQIREELDKANGTQTITVVPTPAITP